MAYDIDVSLVTAVLLADGWHKVKGRSFGIEPYGYVLAAPLHEAEDAAAFLASLYRDLEEHARRGY